MFAQGFERTRWEVKRSRTINGRDGAGNPTTRQETYTETFVGLNTFFKVKVPLWANASAMMLEPGGYEFPFAFVLPPGLPGVFDDFGHSHQATIRYKIKAEVHRAGFFKSDIKHTQRLIINEGLMTDVAPVSKEGRAKVTQCCCIDKGSAWMRATFNKNAYVPGEQAQVVCEVDNQSSIKMRHITTKLKRRITIRDNRGMANTWIETVAQAKHEGVEPFTTCTGEDARMAPVVLANARGPVEPQTHGRLVTCDYWVECQLDVPMGTDVTVDLPTTICTLILARAELASARSS